MRTVDDPEDDAQKGISYACIDPNAPGQPYYRSEYPVSF